MLNYVVQHHHGIQQWSWYQPVAHMGLEYHAIRCHRPPDRTFFLRSVQQRQLCRSRVGDSSLTKTNIATVCIMLFLFDGQLLA